MTFEDEKLKEYFKFDAVDLDANRQGQFSEKQQIRLIEADRRIQRRFGWRSIPLFLIAGIGPLAAISAGDFFGLSWKIIWGFGWTGVWGGIGLVMLLSSLSKPKPLALAKVKGNVNIVRERSYRSSTRRHSTSLQLCIGRHSFDAEEYIADVLMQGNEYILYYEKDWEEIVSAELVTQAK